MVSEYHKCRQYSFIRRKKKASQLKTTSNFSGRGHCDIDDISCNKTVCMLKDHNCLWWALVCIAIFSRLDVSRDLGGVKPMWRNKWVGNKNSEEPDKALGPYYRTEWITDKYAIFTAISADLWNRDKFPEGQIVKIVSHSYLDETKSGFVMSGGLFDLRLSDTCIFYHFQSGGDAKNGAGHC